MKSIIKRTSALAAVLVLGITAARAQSDGALLDALVKKGVLSDQEAEDIRASEAKDYATTPAGKLSISDHITQLKLYGDARFRYEYLDEKPQNGMTTTGDNILERYRYRIRVGVDYTFTDSFKAGFELESSPNNDTANVNFGTQYNKAPINVGLIYLQYKATDWLTLTGGKQRNPLYTTDLVWDPDIDPEGGSEVFSFNVNDKLTVGLTAFQGIYGDNNEFNGPGTPATDVWQFVEQVPVQYNFSKDMFIKEVPGFMTYTSGGTAAAYGPGANGGTNSIAGPNIADHLAIFLAPGEFDLKVGDLPVKAYWDLAINTEGDERVQKVYLASTAGAPPTTAATQKQNQDLGDNVAWLAGVQVGVNKKKGDWSIKADYRQVGYGSIDPNLNDSDWGDSTLNQQGIRVQSVYNFTDFLTGSLTYYDTWAYKEDLLNGTVGQNPAGLAQTASSGGATANVAGLAGASTTQRVQVDVQWKF